MHQLGLASVENNEGVNTSWQFKITVLVLRTSKDVQLVKDNRLSLFPGGQFTLTFEADNEICTYLAFLSCSIQMP